MSGIIGRIKAELIGRIPPEEYIVARQATLEGMRIRAEKMLAVLGLGLLSIDGPGLENAATDATFFAERESKILGFAAQALRASFIEIDHGGGAKKTRTLTIPLIKKGSMS